MKRPLLLDLYCGAGGCSKGYYEAGFDVIGVDINDQPRYPYQFIKYDAKKFLTDYDLSVFSAIHASPPCQKFCSLNHIHNKDYPDDIREIRFLLLQTELPFVIENVPQAPLKNPLMLCGSMFGLKLIRHRIFESNVTMPQPFHAKHHKQPKKMEFVSVFGFGNYGIDEGREAMGINWMIKSELSQAIPPAYTKYIGSQLMGHINGNGTAVKEIRQMQLF